MNSSEVKRARDVVLTAARDLCEARGTQTYALKLEDLSSAVDMLNAAERPQVWDLLNAAYNELDLTTRANGAVRCRIGEALRWHERNSE